MKNRFLSHLVLCLLLAGCSSLGPKKIRRDRVDYGTAMGLSFKEQTVLNIVKSRYLDWPSFLDVGQIVAGYSRQGSATLGWNWFPDANSSNNLDTGVTGTFTESPTITFTPLTGSDFTTTLLEPLDAQSVLGVAYSGWRIDRLLELTVNAVNGKRNAQFVGDGLKSADPEFLRVLALFRDLQTAGAWGLRRQSKQSQSNADSSNESQSQGQSDTLKFIFRPPDDDARLKAKVAEIKKLLGLEESLNTFSVVYGDEADSKSITLEMRTLWEIFWEAQRFVEVPTGDQSNVNPVPGTGGGGQPALRILSSPNPPRRAFVAVPYRGHWFWVQDDDLNSKHTISVILLMSTLARTGSADPPRLVIPTR